MLYNNLGLKNGKENESDYLQCHLYLYDKYLFPLLKEC